MRMYYKNGTLVERSSITRDINDALFTRVLKLWNRRQISSYEFDLLEEYLTTSRSGRIKNSTMVRLFDVPITDLQVKLDPSNNPSSIDLTLGYDDETLFFKGIWNTGNSEITYYNGVSDKTWKKLCALNKGDKVNTELYHDHHGTYRFSSVLDEDQNREITSATPYPLPLEIQYFKHRGNIIGTEQILPLTDDSYSTAILKNYLRECLTRAYQVESLSKLFKLEENDLIDFPLIKGRVLIGISQALSVQLIDMTSDAKKVIIEFGHGLNALKFYVKKQSTGKNPLYDRITDDLSVGNQVKLIVDYRGNNIYGIESIENIH